MPLKITFKDNFIILEPELGTNFRQIRAALARLYYVPGLPDKNRIWLLRDGPENISEDELQGLKEFIQENYPPEANLKKTAIVVDSNFQADMAAAFKQLVADLPFEIEVFTDYSAAEDWIK